MLHDKVHFVMGVANLLASSYWLGCSPETFHIAYTMFALVLFSIRVWAYQKVKWHCYLIDFCYYANLLTLAVIWVWRRPWLFKVSFAFNMGAQALAVILTRNSLVFHSLDKVTSLFLHLAPACLSWAFRWKLPGAETPCPAGAGGVVHGSCSELWGEAGAWDLIVLPTAVYALWAVPYYVKIFIIDWDTIVENKYENLFSFMTERPSGPIEWILKSTPRWAHTGLFMMLHFGMCLTGFVISLGIWKSRIAGAVYIFSVFGWSAWNGR
mmetsp:Transcript_968/g.3711  ORF Transcript_968/g.3711 Transcript_968/m.3711 type:complete len:267 (+) Transcript_968:541-1341(+)